MTGDLSHNPPLCRAFEMARRDANRERRAVAVLNLNPMSGLYVCRDWDDRFAGSRELVAKVEPEAMS
jgi:hypothetical protein